MRAKARTKVMGTLNQVQKGQSTRKGTCKGDGDSEPSAKRSNTHRCARRGDGNSEPSVKRSNAMASGKACAKMMGTLNQVQKGQTRAGARRGDGDSEPSAKRSNTKVHAKEHAMVMGTLNQVQKGQMQRYVQRCAQRCVQRHESNWFTSLANRISLFVLGYHWLPLATIDLVDDNREFEV